MSLDYQILLTLDLQNQNIGENKITVVQPQQRMLYGRLLAGIRSKHNAIYSQQIIRITTHHISKNM